MTQTFKPGDVVKNKVTDWIGVVDEQQDSYLFVYGYVFVSTNLTLANRFQWPVAEAERVYD